MEEELFRIMGLCCGSDIYFRFLVETEEVHFCPNESVSLQCSTNNQCVLCKGKRELVTVKETYKVDLCFVMV
jgi:hypothetical protein